VTGQDAPICELADDFLSEERVACRTRGDQRRDALDSWIATQQLPDEHRGFRISQ